jgi:hypothetical protein
MWIQSRPIAIRALGALKVCTEEVTVLTWPPAGAPMTAPPMGAPETFDVTGTCTSICWGAGDGAPETFEDCQTGWVSVGLGHGGFTTILAGGAVT